MLGHVHRALAIYSLLHVCNAMLLVRNRQTPHGISRRRITASNTVATYLEKYAFLLLHCIG